MLVTHKIAIAGGVAAAVALIGVGSVVVIEKSKSPAPAAVAAPTPAPKTSNPEVRYGSNAGLIYIGGSVKSAGSYELNQIRPSTLKQAITEAGIVPDTQGWVEILRRSPATLSVTTAPAAGDVIVLGAPMTSSSQNLRMIGQAMVLYSTSQQNKDITRILYEDLMSGKVPDIELRDQDHINVGTTVPTTQP